MAKKKKTDFDALFGDDQSDKPLSEFDNLLDSSKKSSGRIKSLVTGDKFRGEILAVSGQEAFVSSGTPVDAVMPFALGLNGEKPKVGDFVEVMVVRVRDGEIVVKPLGSRGGAEADSLEDSFDMELPVEGVVLEEVKGGFRVKVKEHKAFCPISQMDFRVVTPSDYVGKKFEFIITKMERGRDLVVSRRKLLELERAGTEGEFLQSAQVGDIHSGKVFRLEKYGAFVRLDNGLDGLIPISELSWGRINHPQEVVNLDQPVQVKLIRMLEEEGRLKLSFSLKQGGSISDPWATIESDFPVGSTFEGRVEHKEAFGLFVNIGLGVTGLLPRSAFRDSVEGAGLENKKKGDVIKVRVDRIDLEAHKLSFSLPGEEQDDSWRDHVTSQVQPKKSFGSMADLFKDIKGK